MKKLDIHCHVTAFPDYLPGWKNGLRFLSATEQLEVLDKLNVEKGVLLPIVAPDAQWLLMVNSARKITKRLSD